MPTYAYACTSCEHNFEVQQAFTDTTLTECPECTGRVRKLFNSVGIVFKGSGFYRNDSRPGEGKGKDKSSDAASGSDTASGSDQSSSDKGSSDKSSPAKSSDGGTSGKGGTSKPGTDSSKGKDGKGSGSKGPGSNGAGSNGSKSSAGAGRSTAKSGSAA